jgi:hypothetical protein
VWKLLIIGRLAGAATTSLETIRKLLVENQSLQMKEEEKAVRG